MKRLQRAAILVTLAEKLRDQGSWCGETHIQKGTYLLQELLGVPLELEYCLYKHGPYSFDLSDELTSLRADRIFDQEKQPYPYGQNLSRVKWLKKYENFHQRPLPSTINTLHSLLTSWVIVVFRPLNVWQPHFM